MNAGPVLEVARWEYKRFVKVKDLVINAAVVAILTFVGAGFGDYVASRADQVRSVGVQGAEHLPPGADDAMGRVEFSLDLRTSEQWRRDLLSGEIDAWLVLTTADRGELRVTEERGWQRDFLTELEALRRAQRLAESGIDPQRLADLGASLEVGRVNVEADEDGGPARTGFLLVAIIVGAMMFGLFTGLSYVFVAITGEKTQRVTESILSAITAQQWIDGKILGLTGVVMVSLLSWVAGYLIYDLVDALALGGEIGLPGDLGDASALPWVVLLGVSGFAFWFTFFAMIAATISDPNSSSRSSFMLLPFLPLSLAFGGLDDPDAPWMRILALIPGVSPTAMPVRLLRGEPAIWELLLALGLMIAMVWVFRRASGRVFGLSMLMTGKEPSLREVWRWARASQ